jgi:phospholipid/cholesterol/gamma-HCH transport system permease protein
MLSALEQAGRYSAFAAKSFVATLFALARPAETSRQLYRHFLAAWPLAAIAGLAIGIVLWMHLRSILIRFGGVETVQFLPTALTLAVVLEFAPIGAGLIIAGRSGASLAAELGSMKLTEQLDALEMLGHSPMREIVGPRILALTLAMPLLTIFMDYCALFGSFAAETAVSGATWLQYRTASLDQLRFLDVVLGTLKTTVFGFLIGVAGSYFGMTADGGTEGVGRAATRGVVAATLSVVIANVLLVKLIQLTLS